MTKPPANHGLRKLSDPNLISRIRVWALNSSIFLMVLLTFVQIDEAYLWFTKPGFGEGPYLTPAHLGYWIGVIVGWVMVVRMIRSANRRSR